LVSELVGESIGKIVTPVGYDGSAFRPLLLDAQGRPIVLAGNDGTVARALKCNSSGQLEVLVSGKVPDSELLDGLHSSAFVLKSGDTMTGALTLSGTPTVDLHAATKKYVDDHAISPGTLLKNVWCPDAPPAAANAKDDEFDDASFDTDKWTAFDPGEVLTTTEPAQGACLQSITHAGDCIAGQMQAITNDPFTMWCKVSGLLSVANYMTFGIALWEDGILNPATCDIYIFGVLVTAGQYYITGRRFSQYNSWAATTFDVQYVQPMTSLYLRFRYTGTAWEMDFSTNGLGWFWRAAVAPAFTPKQVGMFVDNNGTGVTARGIFSFFRFLNFSQNVRTPPEGRLIHLYG